MAEFVGNLRRDFDDAEVYLFGSYARGTWIEDSDVDLVVVSKHFGGLSLGERAGKIRFLAPRDIPFELLIYTPEELRILLAKSVTLGDASEYWIRL